MNVRGELCVRCDGYGMTTYEVAEGPASMATTGWPTKAKQPRPPVDNGRLVNLEIQEVGGSQWIPVGSVTSVTINEGRSVDVTLASHARLKDDYTMDVEYQRDDRDVGQETVEESGYHRRFVRMRVTHRDSSRIVVEGASTSYVSDEGRASMTFRLTSCVSEAGAYDDSWLAPGTSRLPVLPPAAAINDQARPCHVCGASTVIINAAGLGEHVTCAKWGAA